MLFTLCSFIKFNSTHPRMHSSLAWLCAETMFKKGVSNRNSHTVCTKYNSHGWKVATFFAWECISSHKAARRTSLVCYWLLKSWDRSVHNKIQCSYLLTHPDNVSLTAAGQKLNSQGCSMLALSGHCANYTLSLHCVCMCIFAAVFCMPHRRQ